MIAAPSDIWGINCFQTMVSQLTEPKALAILGVQKSLLRRWLNGTSKVPRMACLALYWETPYGRAMIDSDHIFSVQLLQRRITHLERQNAKYRANIISLMRTNMYGSANDPIAL